VPPKTIGFHNKRGNLNVVRPTARRHSDREAAVSGAGSDSISKLLGFHRGCLVLRLLCGDPAIEHNLPINRNAQADYEQLAYLIWADMVVSNDEGSTGARFRDCGRRKASAWNPRKPSLRC
jgi:hypothetical protein